MRSRYLIWSLANSLHLLEVTWLNWTFSPQPTFSLLADLGRSAPEGSTSSGSTSKGPTHMLRIVPWLIHSFYHRSAKTSWNPYHPCWGEKTYKHVDVKTLCPILSCGNWTKLKGSGIDTPLMALLMLARASPKNPVVEYQSLCCTFCHESIESEVRTCWFASQNILLFEEMYFTFLTMKYQRLKHQRT